MHLFKKQNRNLDDFQRKMNLGLDDMFKRFSFSVIQTLLGMSGFQLILENDYDSFR